MWCQGLSRTSEYWAKPGQTGAESTEGIINPLFFKVNRASLAKDGIILNKINTCDSFSFGLKEKFRRALSHIFELERLDTTMHEALFPPFALTNTDAPLCLTCNISCHLPPPSMLTLNDSVYTHPASIIPFHTSPGLFICLRLWGDMKAQALPPLSHFPFCLLFFPPTTAGSSWPLIYEGLLNPCGCVWSPPGNFGVRCKSVVKTEVVYSSTCLTLLGRVRMLLQAPSANCSIWLQAFAGVLVFVFSNKCLPC